MLWVALSLGFLGSMHCLGMCGPLALGVAGYGGVSLKQRLWQSTQYNLGRTFTYAILGAIVGLFGELIVMSQFQQFFSSGTGVLLIALSLMSLDIEKILFKSPSYQKGYQKITKRIHSILKKGALKYPFMIGTINGILPCGLVYLALTGSLVSGAIWSSMLFMTFFGLGTIPALMILMSIGSHRKFPNPFRINFKKVFIVLQFLFGIFLIYRSFAVEVPVELDFWTAIKHDVMCH